MVNLVCWNVAGWGPTMEFIRKDYRTLAEFFRQHDADIVCLQEFKQTNKSVEDKPAAVGAREEGWDLFTSLYRPTADATDRRSSGTWNGVATFAKTGRTLRADPAPLGIAELDNEGRCLFTDHGSFVLFNVYVPASGNHNKEIPWKSVPIKMAFLDALRRAVRQQLQQGREVIIAGDLNLTHRPVDAFWKDRILELRRLFREPRAGDGEEYGDEGGGEGSGRAPYALPEPLQSRLVESRQIFRQALASVEFVFVPGKDKKAAGGGGGGGGFGRASDSYRAMAPVLGKGEKAEKVRLGTACESEGLMKARWCKTGDIIFDPHPISAALGPEAAVESLRPDRPLVAWRTGWLSVAYISEIFAKVLCSPLSEADLRALAACGENHSSPCARDWIGAVVAEDGFVDSYADLFPNARGRATCWEQYTNRRYENEGNRIDAILVSRGLWASARPKSVQPLFSAGRAEWESEEAALAAATCGGSYAPAPFEGGGLDKQTPRAVLDTQFEGGGSGIRYTPPHYSDHVAISLQLELPPAEPLALKGDKATLASQPHRQTRSLKSFFAPKAAAAASSQGAAGSTAGGGAGPSSSGAAAAAAAATGVAGAPAEGSGAAPAGAGAGAREVGAGAGAGAAEEPAARGGVEQQAEPAVASQSGASQGGADASTAAASVAEQQRPAAAAALPAAAAGAGGAGSKRKAPTSGGGAGGNTSGKGAKKAAAAPAPPPSGGGIAKFFSKKADDK